MTSKEQNNVVAADSSDKIEVERSARPKMTDGRSR